MIQYENNVYKTESESERNEKVNNRFRKALYSKCNDQVHQYLKERNIDKDIIEKFSIGWCPEEVNFPPYLKHLEYLKGRIIFPIRDEYGDIVSFSGRLPCKNSEGLKWWHESCIKSFHLYAIDLAIESILKEDKVIIVEGQLDAISCHKNGLTNVVACMGTAFTPQHVAKLARLTTNFYLMFDGDSAGRNAATRAKDYLNLGCKKYNYKDIVLKSNGVEYDPDELISKYGINPILKKIKMLGESQ